MVTYVLGKGKWTRTTHYLLHAYDRHAAWLVAACHTTTTEMTRAGDGEATCRSCAKVLADPTRIWERRRLLTLVTKDLHGDELVHHQPGDDSCQSH